MTNRKNTGRALAMSLLSLLLCASMLVGTTFAWFTDSVTSANNTIISGNLDIALDYLTAEGWKSIEGKSDILSEDLYEPGYVQVAYLKLENKGSLALQYRLGVNIIKEDFGVNQSGEQFNLSDYIHFGLVKDLNGETDAYTKREDAVKDLTETKLIKDGISSEDTMLPGDVRYVALVVYMPETVGNAANHNGVKIPQIDLGINVFATQYTYEEDSFNNQYDAGAQLPIQTVSATTWDEVVALAAEGKHIVLKNNIEGATTIKMNGGSIDGDGHTMTFTAAGRGAVVVDPTGGTIKNVKIVNPNANMFDNQWAIGSMQMLNTALTDDLYIENVDISGFKIVLDMKADGHSIHVKNSEITNWMQINGAEETVFEGCHFKADGAAQLTFNQPSSMQAIIFLMGDMTFTNCHFEENVNFYLDSTRYSGTVNFNNSTYGNNGVENRPIDSFGFIKYWFPATGVYGYAGTFGDTKPAQTHFNWYINGELVWDATAV